ncbi:hypothetical protein DZA65_00434 [Dickeya dianthicola]|nr:Phage integrase [Dickeya dianthicola RNS04.9]AYC17348.1 hypothetical protein DZA65_00434 [Dickeya dianthicola]
MALTDIKVRTAKPSDKQYKLTDGNGMHLLVHPNGAYSTVLAVNRRCWHWGFILMSLWLMPERVVMKRVSYWQTALTPAIKRNPIRLNKVKR